MRRRIAILVAVGGPEDEGRHEERRRRNVRLGRLAFEGRYEGRVVVAVGRDVLGLRGDDG